MLACSKCGQTKPKDDFSVDKKRSYRDFRAHSCKSCNKRSRDANRESLLKKKKEYRIANLDADKARHKDYYLRNKNKILQEARDFFSDNRHIYLYKKSKERAKKAGIYHSLSPDDIVIPSHCPYLGIELTSTLGEGQLETNASLDRIDSSKGYFKENIQVISRKANTMKNNASQEELITFALNVLKLHDPASKGTGI